MKYTEQHFKPCQFNPLEENLLAAYPELAEFLIPFNLTAGVRELRYIIMMYDPKTPLKRSTHLMAAQKMEAAQLSGFDLEKDEKKLEEMYDFTDPQFTLLVSAYLARFVQSKKFVMLITLEQVWWEYNSNLLKKVTGENSKQELDAIEKKSKLRVEMEAIIQTMDRYREEFYGKDEVLIEQVGKQRISAENIANAIKRNS
jgi:hypothetical protein